MSRRTTIPLAITLLVLYVVGVVATGFLETSIERSAAVGLWSLIPTGALAVFGTLIVLRHRGNLIGWAFLVTASLWATGSAADAYSVYSLEVRAEPLPGTTLAAWVGEWYWIPYLCLMFVAIPLLFPTGRTASPRWRVFGRVVLAAAAVTTLAAAFDPTLDLTDSKQTISNPIGFGLGADPDDGGWPGVVLGLLIVGGGSASVASLFSRFKRSAGAERQQLKWFLYGTGLFLTGFLVSGLMDATGHGRPPAFVEALVFSLLPAAASVAILRYRLYDIDVIINRTLVYGVLTAILAAAYAGLVVAFQRALSPLTEQSDVAVAASTLAVAGLFGPVRSRVQSFIDRRFYRSRYDAQQTLENFSARLRDEVDLEHLTSELVGVVTTTMRPRHASLWLREAAR